MGFVVIEAKDPDRPKTYELDMWADLVVEARRSYEFELGDVVRWPRDTGLYYECTVAGRTAAGLPYRVPTIAGETMLDGSVEWTARHPDAVSEATISSVVYVLPEALTLDAQSETDHLARFTVSGGVDGYDYDITATITPSSGAARDVTIRLPVRSQ